MKNYIIFDLEWNQSPRGREDSVADFPFEIIEIGAVKPGLKTRMFFNVMAKVQRGGGRVSVDADYWKAKGWTEGKRPWK